MFTEFLLDEGIEVDAVAHGADALQILAMGPLPCVILTDWRMPVMDGRRFREELLKNDVWAQIPTVVISAYAKRGEIDPARFARVLAKPMEAETLPALVRELCLREGT